MFEQHVWSVWTAFTDKTWWHSGDWLLKPVTTISRWVRLFIIFYIEDEYAYKLWIVMKKIQTNFFNTVITCRMHLNLPCPVPSIASPFLSRSHRPITTLPAQAAVSNIIVLPAKVLTRIIIVKNIIYQFCSIL